MPIAILFMFVALALITPTLMHGIQQDNQLIMGTVAAKQLHQVTEAAKGYITAYAGAIEGSATATTPATITVPMLVNTGFLPQGFQAGNPYGQTWEVQVLQPQPGNLQALVLSQGGTPIQPADAPRIASEAGAEGGTIDTANNTAQGSYGGWSVSMNGYANPGAGHLAALVAYSGGQLQSDYLYRVAVPGQPQLNTMQTNLNMGSNSVNNANEVNAQSETLAGGQPNGQPGALQIGSNYYYGDSSNAAVRTPGSFYIQNQNGSGPAQIAEVSNVWGSGELQGGYVNSTGDVNAQWNSGATNAFAMNNGAWWANNAGDSSQSGNANVGGQVTAGYDATLGTAGGSANIGWGCGPNGAIAANANGSGQVLACQGGSWQAMGGGSGLGITSLVYTSPVFNNVGLVGLGWFRYCAVSYNQSNAALYPENYGGNGYWYWYFNGAGNTFSQVSCYD